jgi:plastocyanin
MIQGKERDDDDPKNDARSRRGHGRPPRPRGGRGRVRPEEETAATPEAPAGEEPTVIVGIQNLEFLEVELFVPPGVAVTWINNDEVAHTVTHGEGGAAAPGALFDERLDGGESFDWSFAEPGLYLVTCTIHPEMNMQVNVIE